MSSIITSILNLTFGLLWNKLRDRVANELKEGDLTDEKCRQWIVRELDDIASMLNSLARKDLLSSISFLKEGVRLLSLSFDRSADDDSTLVQEQKDESVGRDHTLRTHVKSKHHEDIYFKETFRLSRKIRYLDIASKERFASAKSAFGDARREATRAFCNRTLRTEDRIFATKLRVISRILESLDDPIAAAETCKLYLEELHDMEAVCEIFSVHFNGGIKAHFNKTKRFELMTSVIMINYVLGNFIMNFAETEFDLFSWPRIQLLKRTLHPIMDVEIRAIMNKFGVGAPNRYEFRKLVYPTKSPGRSIIDDIMVMNNVGKSVEVINAEGDIQFCFNQTQEVVKGPVKLLHAVVMDEEDNIYVVTYFNTSLDALNFELCVSDSKGTIIAEFPLEFLTTAENEYRSSLQSELIEQSDTLAPNDVELALNMDKDVFLGHQLRIYICNSRGQLKSSFQTVVTNELMSICNVNEIISAKYSGRAVYVYSETGELKRQFKVVRGQVIYDVVFNPITKKIFVLTHNCHTVLQLECYSEFGELLQTLPLEFSLDFRALLVLPNGLVAVVHGKGFILA